jgi:hypothetical protein
VVVRRAGVKIRRRDKEADLLREEVMHEPIKGGLEAFLRGDGSKAFLEHLEACPKCRAEAGRFADQAAMVRLLRVDEELDPAPGFYARVMARVESQSRASFWGPLLDPMFGRRLMYASLTMVILLGTYLFTAETREAAVPPTTAAERYLVEQHPSVGANPQQDRDTVLVRLATYGE